MIFTTRHCNAIRYYDAMTKFHGTNDANVVHQLDIVTCCPRQAFLPYIITSWFKNRSGVRVAKGRFGLHIFSVRDDRNINTHQPVFQLTIQLKTGTNPKSFTNTYNPDALYIVLHLVYIIYVMGSITQMFRLMYKKRIYLWAFRRRRCRQKIFFSTTNLMYANLTRSRISLSVGFAAWEIVETVPWIPEWPKFRLASTLRNRPCTVHSRRQARFCLQDPFNIDSLRRG